MSEYHTPYLTPHREKHSSERGPFRRGMAILGIGAVGLAAAGLILNDFKDRITTSCTGETSIEIAPGNTVWGLAEGISANNDTRNIVAEIHKMNPDADFRSLKPGETLVIPESCN